MVTKVTKLSGGHKTRKRERLSPVDWLNAGQAVLIEEGIAGLRLAKLTQRLSVSIGSFYHHFDDMDSFLRALSDYYAADIIGTLIEEICASEPDPVERLKQLYLRTEAQDLLRFDAAMRSLALIEPHAKIAMAKSEAQVMTFMTDALVEAGFVVDDARARAFAMLSMEMASTSSLGQDELHRLRRRAFAVLTRLPTA